MKLRDAGFFLVFILLLATQASASPLATTYTSVSCVPAGQVVVGQEVTCTAIVYGSDPTGSVTWPSAPGGTFGSPIYVYSVPEEIQTYVTYSQTAAVAGTVTITANYAGDLNNQPSSGSTTVTFITAPTSLSCASPASLAALSLPLSLIGFALLALLVSINVVAVGYIISKIIPTAGISGWINQEFVEIAKSGMLIVGIFSIITFMSNVSALFVPSGPTGTYQGNIAGLTKGACAYLGTVSSGLEDTITYMLSMNTAVGSLFGLTEGAYVPIPIPPLPPFDVWFEFGYQYKPYENEVFESTTQTATYESIVNDFFTLMLFPLTFLILAQEALLPTLVLLGLVVLIPFGLILRAFPFVRGIGGTLVAMGIGTAIIYPSLLVMLNAPLTTALSFGSIAPSPPASSSSCGPVPIVCYAKGIYSDIVSGSLSSAVAAQNAGYNDGFGAMSGLFTVVNGMISYGFYLMLQLILFIADLMIAFPLVDTIARSLGGTIQLSLGGKLKLI